MPLLTYDLLFCLTFFIILLSVVKLWSAQTRTGRPAFAKMIVGLTLLTGFSLVQIVGHQGIFAGVPYLQEEGNRKILEATAIVGGLIFLLIGVGELLPSLTRGRRMFRRAARRYFGLKMIVQATSSGKTLDETYDVVMNHLTSTLGMTRWAAFKYAAKQDLLILTGTVGFPEKLPRQLRTVSLRETELLKKLNGFRAVVLDDTVGPDAESTRPRLVIPVAYGGRLFGALFHWGDTEIDDEAMDLLTLLGNMLGRQAQEQVARTRTEYYRSRQTAIDRVNELCNRAASVGDILSELFGVLKDATGAEFCSLAILDNSGENMTRYTIGSAGRMLLEKGVSRSTGSGVTYRIAREGQPMLEADIDGSPDRGDDDGLFLSCGMHSRLACPVMVGNRPAGVITLGHSQPGHFTPAHQHRVGDIVALLAGLIQREQLSRTLEIREDQMLRLQMMERELASDESVQSMFDQACQLLTKRMKCTVARISLVDRDGKNLQSQACRAIRDTGHDLKENAALPISLLPWHKMAMEARKPMLINREDPQSQMPPQESTAALLPEIRSAILLPIVTGNTVQGIISIGEARNWNRRPFGASDLIFARDVAAKCSVALRLKKLEMAAEKSRLMAGRIDAASPDRLAELATRLKSPLTSIIGAVELLKLKGDSRDERTRYQEMILKAADRITALSGEYASPHDTVEMQEEEPVVG